MRCATIATILLAVTACSSRDEEKKPAGPPPGITTASSPAPKTPIATQPTTPPPGAPANAQEIAASIEKAMSEIPPELREKFQDAFACYNRREEEAAKAKGIARPPLTGDDIRRITKELQNGNTQIATC